MGGREHPADASDAHPDRGDMEAAACTLFDTAIGRCGISWRGERVIAFALPAASDAATCAQLRRRHPEAQEAPPPAPIAVAIASVQRLLEGESEDLRAIAVDLEGVPAFERRVYNLLRQVRPGETITYGELASQAGAPGAARAVGAAMGRNPIPVIIPCHRVLAGSGRSGASRLQAGSRPSSGFSRSSRRGAGRPKCCSRTCRWR